MSTETDGPSLPSSSPSKRYAIPEDWPRFQDTIVRLYVEDNKTLDEVRQYMEEHHDFVATISMYKRQLASWNVFKNLRFDEVLQILRLKRQREAEHNKESVYFIRDRRIETDSLQVYISRNPSLYAKLESGEEPHLDAVRDVSCRSPSPMPPEPGANQPSQHSSARDMTPEAIIIPRPASDIHEDLICFIRAYMSQSFGSGTWTKSGSHCWSTRGHQGPTELLKSLLDRCMTAALSIGRQVEPAVIRHALDAPFTLLIRVFKNPPPEMIPRVLCIAARLELIGRKEMQGILLQFCSDLAKALYGRSHVLSRFWQTFLDIPSTERKKAIEVVLVYCVSEFEDRLGASNSLSMETYLLYFDAVERQNDPEAQACSLQRQLSKIDDQVADPSARAMLQLEYALATCKTYLAEDLLDKAEDILSSLNVTALSSRDESFRCLWLGYIQWIKGDITAAEKRYKDSVKAAKRTGSRDCACEALFQLETFYLHRQEPLQAERVRAERFDVLRRMNSVVWLDNSNATALEKDSEHTPKVTIIRIGSDLCDETWNPTASALMLELHNLRDQESTGAEDIGNHV